MAIPLPPLNINSASSAGANTGGFSIGGLNLNPNAQSFTAQLPIIAVSAVAVAALIIFTRN
ncbi:hypothetical protein [Zhongshania sp. BJYM1]|uniref:hypothetical protein n=1 Tax=Zhongshania aquatica TaxID=2965069 RepID=UPI0022B4A6D7|nr:hypothetical protein [Marortus sp. BJYM1]